jgi:cysteinyl-tRNA synthetase
MPSTPPDAVVDLARARAEARAARDFATADRLRAEIEAAGWRIVDRGTDFSLEPAHPPDLTEGAR